MRSADDIALQAHAGQVDKAGMPYIEHPRRVARNAALFGRILWPQGDQTLLVEVALLHDVLEDCEGWTRERLIEEGIRPSVVSIVEIMSHAPDESRETYIGRVITGGAVAILVKAADLADNSDPIRLAKLTQEEQSKFATKYGPDIARIRAAIKALA